MHDDRIDKLRVHEKNLKKIESYDLSNPSEVYEAQKFLEKCFNDKSRITTGTKIPNAIIILINLFFNFFDIKLLPFG